MSEKKEMTEQQKLEAVRLLVRRRIQELVRKKDGGGGYVLYNPRKKGGKPVATFPTRRGVKRAELARFPPKDSEKLQTMRKSVAKDSEKPDEPKKEESISVVKNESKERLEEMHRKLLGKVIRESLFQEEVGGSEWDDFIGKLSTQALGSDSKFLKLQKNIDKRTAGVLQDAFTSIRKAVDKTIKMKDLGIKRDPNLGKTYLLFSATMDNVEVAPIYIYAENGIPKIEVSSQAKIALTKVDPENAKLFRAELVTTQERILDKEEDLIDSIQARDRYLAKVEEEVDSFVAGLTSLQISILKQLLVSKYRKLK